MHFSSLCEVEFWGRFCVCVYFCVGGCWSVSEHLKKTLLSSELEGKVLHRGRHAPFWVLKSQRTKQSKKVQRKILWYENREKGAQSLTTVGLYFSLFFLILTLEVIKEIPLTFFS